MCPYSCSVPGGVQTQVLGLARALQERGDQACVIAPAATSRPPDGFDAHALTGARFIRVGGSASIAVNGSRAPVSPWPWTMWRTEKALREFAPDVVHIHEPFVPGPALGALLGGIHPLVGTFHRSGVDRAYRAYGLAVRGLSRRLEAMFAVSQEARSTALATVAGSRAVVRIIPNGVEVARLASVRPWPKLGPTLAFVGRHERRKGLEILLQAFESLDCFAHLWVMGQGPETQRLQRCYGANPLVEWLGPVSDEERSARLAGADVLVAPSLTGESFGLVLLEAMAVGTAVVASDLPGYRLAAEGAARLVPVGDAGALAAALTQVLCDDAERQSLCEKGSRRAGECDMSRVADLYREAYRMARHAGGSE